MGFIFFLGVLQQGIIVFEKPVFVIFFFFGKKKRNKDKNRNSERVIMMNFFDKFKGKGEKIGNMKFYKCLIISNFLIYP